MILPLRKRRDPEKMESSTPTAPCVVPPLSSKEMKFAAQPGKG